MNLRLSALFFTLVLIAACLPTTAKADSIDTFDYQPCNQSVTLPFPCVPTGDTYTWQVPSSPIPTSYTAVGADPAQGFEINALVTLDGTTVGSTAINFGGSYCGNRGGFNIPSLGIYGCGPVFWTGNPSAPTFITGGPFDIFLSDVPSPEIGTLTITASEPGTLVLLGASLLGIIGYSLLKFRTVLPT